jgi:hypothetical protein
MKSELVNALIEPVKEYIRYKLEQMLKKAADKVSTAASRIFASIFFLFCFACFVLFASIALALFISDFFDKPYSGFLAVSILYLISGFFFYKLRNIFIKKPLMKIFNGLIDQK